MKKSWSFITLLAALAAGTASAQQAATPATTAGTVIKNTAEITFTPEGSTTPTTTPSNEVTTTVLPKPSFSITPNDGSTDVTKPDYTKPGQTATVKPCDKNVSFKYVLTNTGNVPSESYTLTNTPDPTGAVKTPDNIRYYPAAADTDNSGTLSAAEIAAATTPATQPITSIAGVNPNQAVTFFQVYDIPCAALDTDKYGADPSGTRNPNPTPAYEPTAPFTQPVDKNNSNVSTVARNDSTVIGPKNDPLGATDATVTPAYPSTDPTPVTITPNNNDEQIANATVTTTQVTFTNTVKNTGNRDDVLNISQTNNFPAGTTVTLLKPDGTPLVDTNGDGKPDVGSVAPGGTADVLVKVTFPAGTAPTAGTVPTVTVVVTSSNDPTKSDPTKDIVNLPGLSFGDPTPTPGGDPTPVGTPIAGQPGNPATPVIIPDVCTAPIKTSVPMEVANLGSAADTFDISGTASIVLKSGASVPATLTYYKDVNGNQIFDAGDTALTDSNGNGTADTGALAPGAELKLVAVLDVPCDAAKQTVTLTQTAKSPTTGATVTDKNDTVTIGQSGTPTATKAVDKAKALPGETLTYTVVGENKTNANITNAKVCDTLPANTSFVSWTATSTATGTVLYSNNGGTSWTAAAPTAAGTKLCAAVDTSGDGNITTADILKPGEKINVTYQVKIN